MAQNNEAFSRSEVCVLMCVLAYLSVHLALCFYLRIGIALVAALTDLPLPLELQIYWSLERKERKEDKHKSGRLYFMCLYKWQETPTMFFRFILLSKKAEKERALQKD